MKENNLYYCYILECSDGSYYCGITNNIDKRVKKHNKGIASKYTRCRLPVKLIYGEICESKSAALKREFSIKKLSRDKKEDLIYNYELNEQNRINRV